MLSLATLTLGTGHVTLSLATLTLGTGHVTLSLTTLILGTGAGLRLAAVPSVPGTLSPLA